MAQDVEVAVICTDFVKGILRTVPLVQYFLDHVLVPVQSKANRPFVRRPPGIAIHFQLHPHHSDASAIDLPPTHSHLLSGELHAEPRYNSRLFEVTLRRNRRANSLLLPSPARRRRNSVTTSLPDAARALSGTNPGNYGGE